MSLKYLASKLVVEELSEEEILKSCVYKSGKSIDDVRQAVKKAKKNALGIVDLEKDLIGQNLSKVLKPKQ